MAAKSGFNIIYIFGLLLNLTLVHSQSQSAYLRNQLTSLDKDRQIDSLTCIARRFCTPEAAIGALVSEASLTRAQAEDITSYTHGTSEIKWNSCSCSITCGLSGNCCPDAQPLQEFSKSIQANSKCDFYGLKSIVVIDSCPSTIDSTLAESLQELCQNEDDREKVTNPNSYVTYSNIYCAMCHGEKITDLRPWDFKLICSQQPNGEVENKTEGVIFKTERCHLDEEAPQSPPKGLGEKISSIYGALLYPSVTSKQACKAYDIAVDTCPPGVPKATADACVNGATAYATTDATPHVVYKNPACALCHNIQRENLQCQICKSNSACSKGRPYETKNTEFFLRFSILVQPYSAGAEKACQVESDGEDCDGVLTSVPSCNIGEYLDPWTVTCKPVCPLGSILFKGSCILRSRMSSAICDDAVSYDSYLTIGRKNRVTQSKFNNNAFYMDLKNGTIICHSCTRNVLTEYNEGLTKFTNGSAKMNATVVDRLLIFEEDNFTYLCFPKTSRPNVRHEDEGRFEQKILLYQEWLTLVLCIISIIFLILFFIAFCLIKRMRNIPGSTIAGNMLMFLLAYIFFLARGLDEHYPNTFFCKFVAVIVNYFFMAAFIFMIIYAGLIIRSLEFVDLDSRYTPMTVGKIWSAGLLLPFTVIVPALILDEYIPDSVWSPGYGGDHCFMSHREGNILFFTAPIALCLLISMSIYVVVVQRLMQIAAATSRVRESHREKVYLCFKLIVVLGFNWISAILAAAVDRTTYPIASDILSAIFIILCCLHGFFGFIVFVASGSNIQQMKARYQKLTSTDPGSSSGSRAVRTYSGPTSTAGSELSTMIRKNSPEQTPKGTPVITAEFAKPDITSHKDYSSTDNRLSPNSDSGVGDVKYNDSPISNRSTGSKHKCDFF